MCASFSPPKPPSAFTVGKAGQEAPGTPRRQNNSTPRQSRSPSPLSHASLNGVAGHAFGKEDFAKALSAAGSLSGGGGGGGGSGGGGGGSGAYAFTAAKGVPAPLSISHALKPRGGYSIDNAGPVTAPATASLTAPLVPPTGDETPASFRSSSAGAVAACAGFAADSPTTAAGHAARSFTAGTAPRPVPAIPTFSEIVQGAIRAGGDLPLEPLARARVRAAEEGWARRETERQEREKRWRVKVLSCATLLVLVVVVACRCIGVGITISGPAGAAPPIPGKNKANKPSSSTAPPQNFLSAAASEMPAIASSKEEFVAALRLAGLKKPKPQKIDRAWSALASGENRGAAGGAYHYVGGGALAAKVVVAGVLRNPDFVAILAAALATAFVTFSHRRRSRRSWGWIAVGSGGGGTSARGGREATNGSGSTRAAELLRPGSRGARGVGTANGHVGNGVGVKPRVGVGVRGASSSLSPRRLVGS